MQVDPGGETSAKRNGGVIYESADVRMHGNVVGRRQEARIEGKVDGAHGKVSITGERGRVKARGRSPTRAEQNRQHALTDKNDAPDTRTEPHQP